MADRRKETPDFFEDNVLDPVDAATGYPMRSRQAAAERSRSAFENTPAKTLAVTVPSACIWLRSWNSASVHSTMRSGPREYCG